MLSERRSLRRPQLKHEADANEDKANLRHAIVELPTRQNLCIMLRDRLAGRINDGRALKSQPHPWLERWLWWAEEEQNDDANNAEHQTKGI